jgi:hypothetical protein
MRRIAFFDKKPSDQTNNKIETAYFQQSGKILEKGRIEYPAANINTKGY